MLRRHPVDYKKQTLGGISEGEPHIRDRKKCLLILRDNAFGARIVSLCENIFVVGNVLQVKGDF